MKTAEITQAKLMVLYDYKKKGRYISDSDALRIATERVRIRHMLSDYEGPVLSGQVNIQDA